MISFRELTMSESILVGGQGVNEVGAHNPALNPNFGEHEKRLPEDDSAYAIAIYPYLAEQNGELDVVVGDTFVIRSRAQGWCNAVRLVLQLAVPSYLSKAGSLMGAFWKRMCPWPLPTRRRRRRGLRRSIRHRQTLRMEALR
ncbi:hypothetical protein HGRIS_004828 [Hohenbuehelia grisea]|uniref:SH3 domain-containing protein n=1 Tax=Hohenbuehelia grisea TaxID=104357 RepID=A0ABR3JED6_9AGAR